MNDCLPVPLLIAIALASGMSCAKATLLTNGDFSGGNGGTLAPGSASGGSVSVPTGWVGFATGNQALQVTGNFVKFSAGNQPVGSWIQQAVATTPGLWYTLNWDTTANRANQSGVTTAFWAGTDTSGPPNASHEFHWVGSYQNIYRATDATTTLRISDDGSNTISSDTNIDNLVMDLANGLVNIAPLATPSISSAFGGGWGNPNNAIDGGVADNSFTTFHGANGGGGDFYQLDFSETFTLRRIEVAARPGFNDRVGTQLEILGQSGVLASYAMSPTNLFQLDGVWDAVTGVRVTDGNSYLNIAELRTFAEFSNGAALVPEPSTLGVFAVSMLGLIGFRRRRKLFR